MKMTVFWNAAPCSLIEIYHVSEVLTASFTCPDDGSRKYL
jgi:hypothetical protein